MARDHARTKTSIWKDPDFISLPALAQRAYWLISSQQRLSYCGAMDWWPQRLSALASDTSETDIYDHIAPLVQKRFIVLDPQTSEVLVRTYVRHDGVLDRPNMGKACISALNDVQSLELTEVVITELARLLVENESLPGFKGIREGYGDIYKLIERRAETLPAIA